MNIQLNIEFFAGTDIDSACLEIVELSKKLNVVVMGQFNGVNLMAKPHTDPVGLKESWEKELKSKVSYKIASCH